MVWYGSIENRFAEHTASPKPEVGMGATEMQYSDRTPWEIIEVKDERHITVRELDARRTDSWGMGEIQEYEYAPNPNNRTARLFLTKRGQWKQRLGKNRLGATVFVLGRAEKYYDFTF